MCKITTRKQKQPIAGIYLSPYEECQEKLISASYSKNLLTRKPLRQWSCRHTETSEPLSLALVENPRLSWICQKNVLTERPITVRFNITPKK